MKKFFLLILIGLSLGQAPTVFAQDATQCKGYYECVCNEPPPLTGHSLSNSSMTTPEACAAYCYTMENPGTYDFSCWLGGTATSSGVKRYETSGTAAPADQATVPTAPPRDPIIPNLNVDIPGLDLEEFADSVTPNPRTGEIESNLLGYYVSAVYQFLILAGSLIAVTMIMIGGLQYATARGDSGQVGKAKTRIQNAVTGVILLLLAYNIAFLVDPGTVAFKSLNVQYVRKYPEAAKYAFLDEKGQGLEDQYKAMSCPSQAELEKGVTFFTTGYYKPGYGEAGHTTDFWCNIGMQCSCPEPYKRSDTASCSNRDGQWKPCNPFPEGTPYCNKMKNGQEPIAMVSAAVSPCLPPGTVFKVFGSPAPGVDSSTWVAGDAGAWILGRRIDLFTGTGQNAFEVAKKASAEVTIRVCPGNDESKCPTSAQ